MSKIIPLIACLALVTTFAGGQTLSGLTGVVSPSSAPVGAPITLTITAYGASTGLSTLGFSGIFTEIHQGSPTGPCVWCPFGFTNPTSLAVGQSMSSTWDQTDINTGLPVPPGDYYLKVNTWGSPTFFHARIEDTNPQPTFSAQGPATMGQPLVIDLDNGQPGAFYVAACAFSSNTGVALSPTAHLSLDQDALFGLSFPAANPALFAGMQGTLDGTGHGAVAMQIPSAPFLVDVGILWQAVVITPQGFELTNTEGIRIQ